MAIRLTKAFGSTPETWLRMQLASDLAAARKDESKIRVHHQHARGNFTSTDRFPASTPATEYTTDHLQDALAAGAFRRFRFPCCLAPGFRVP
jgi:phage terminase large subunit GpA-like protein